MESIQLQGKIFLTGTIKAITGLHIGGDSENLDIGGVDNPVIRDLLTKEPYIPGSTFRGKMRGLLDRHFDRSINKGRDVKIHECQDPKNYNQCAVCQVFGVAPSSKALRGNTMPTRLIVRDTFLRDHSRKELEEAETDSLFTEVKWEVTIDRITSAANPRPIERVPAGTTFGPFQLVYGIYTRNTVSSSQVKEELDLFDIVFTGMALLEDDYLGGSGSRGSGRITFQKLGMTFKPRTHYEKKGTQSVPIAQDTDIETLRNIDYKQKILDALGVQ